MRTTTNNPNPRGNLIGEFGVEPSDLVVRFPGVKDAAGGEHDRKAADPCRGGGRVLTGLTLRRPNTSRGIPPTAVGSGLTDAALIDEALAALPARHRSAEVDASYRAYDEHPPDEPDAWGDLASWRRVAGTS